VGASKKGWFRIRLAGAPAIPCNNTEIQRETTARSNASTERGASGDQSSLVSALLELGKKEQLENRLPVG
jgi:hypothetical protein